MEVIILPDVEAASQIAANLFVRQIHDKPDSVLGLATGGTPVRLYEILAERHSKGEIDFSKVTSFNLDEYVGLGADHPASYHHFMEEKFFSKVNIATSHIPDGLTSDIPAHCAAYERKIQQSGGIDLQLLGLGTDGHLGFNEPGSSLASRTRIKTLTERTRNDNARYFDDISQVPHHVITMGLGTIMDSHTCVLLAFGKGKAKAVAECVEGPVTASVPGSLLQFHPRAKVILDKDAASSLRRLDYYNWVYANKPGWQKDM